MREADPAARDGNGAAGGLPPKALLVLAGVFSAAALGCLVLIGVDLSIGRPASGDLFIGGLNGVLAAVFWAWFVRSRPRGAGADLR
ncbi:hypothetical protein [Pseudarthrobacter albicanus]|uniref:hypothetical protein n=1 Tax=Pseudarthrobacter albicanus TaxID=2823873 RepID=UPI001BA58930|nr:hypothetical protein [Pseudarthrobacter albicanus]